MLIVNFVPFLVSASLWKLAFTEPIPPGDPESNDDYYRDYLLPPGMNALEPEYKDYLINPDESQVGTRSVAEAKGLPAGQELVWLEDRNNDHDRRNLDRGLPKSLEFNLKRKTGSDVKLQLRENAFLNYKVPVYEVTDDGDLVKMDFVRSIDKRFYHDKNAGAAVKISCENQKYGACQRILEGSLNIEGRNYEIKPAPASVAAKGMGNHADVPHLLIRVPEPNAYQNSKRNIGPYGNDYIHVPGTEPVESDQAELKSIPTEAELEDKIRKLFAQKDHQTPKDRQKREAKKIYGISMIMIIDPGLWKKYYDLTTADEGITKTQATINFFRERFVHIINGVSLRYEAIEDSSMEIQVNISKILVKRKLSKPMKIPVSNYDGVQKVDSEQYIDSIKNIFLKTTEDYDLGMVITGYTLSSRGNDGIVGLAYLRTACDTHRHALVEDADYFTVTTVVAHELGHSLGAYHDGQGPAYRCSPNSAYIMRARIIQFFMYTTYRINSWRFSECSVREMKAYLSSGICKEGPAFHYDAAEWTHFSELEPGQRYTPDEQCKLIGGEDSYHCGIAHNDQTNLCLLMQCYDSKEEYCKSYVGARGTPCGEHKLCKHGKCVFEDGYALATPKPTMRPIADTCTDTHLEVFHWPWDCEHVNTYYTTIQKPPYASTYWCSEYTKRILCCRWCETMWRKLYPERYYAYGDDEYPDYDLGDLGAITLSPLPNNLTDIFQK